MSSEIPVTPEPPAAEPSPEVTAPPEPSKAEPKPKPDFEAAYVGLQRSQNKLHRRIEDVLEQNAALASTVEVLKKGQGAVLRNTLGEEGAKAFENEQAISRERSQASAAARATGQFMTAQTTLFLDLLREAGVDPNGPEIDWGKDASNVNEWVERVGPSVKQAIRKANDSRIRKHEEALTAKTQRAIQEEAAALTQRELKANGVDRIDTAKGGGSSSFTDRIRNLDTSTQEGRAEMDRLMRDARAGRLKT